MRSFQIGTTDVRPSAENPPSKNLRVCHTHGRTHVAQGGTANFKCETIGRYVVIQNKDNEVLTLCEVEVYGHPSMYFDVTLIFCTVVHEVC